MTVKEKSKVKEAYRIFDFMEEQVWLHMLKDRNDTSHIYDGDIWPNNTWSEYWMNTFLYLSN